MPLNKDQKQFIQKSVVSLEAVSSDINSVWSELQETFDDLSEAMQTNESGNDLMAAIETLEELHGEIETVIASLYELNPQPAPKKRIK